MPRPRPPFLQKQVSRHGKVICYVRRGAGPRIRIRAPFGSAQFAAEYQAAVAEITAAQPKGKVGAGSLEWLIRQYRESSAWAIARRRDAGPAREYPSQRREAGWRRSIQGDHPRQDH